MTRSTFTLKPGLTTREVNTTLRDAMTRALHEFRHTWALHDVQPSQERHRYTPFVAPGVRGDRHETRYVFGIGTMLRATLVATYTVGESDIHVVFPNGYTSWDTSDPYTQLRVRIWDLILHAGILHTDDLRRTA